MDLASERVVARLARLESMLRHCGLSGLTGVFESSRLVVAVRVLTDPAERIKRRIRRARFGVDLASERVVARRARPEVACMLGGLAGCVLFALAARYAGGNRVFCDCRN